MAQYWKSALAGAAVVILSATTAAGTASAHELHGMAKAGAAAPADREGDCVAYLSIRRDHHDSGYEIRFRGSSFGWEPRERLRIIAVLTVNGHREDSVSATVRHGRDVSTPTGTDFVRHVRFATVRVRAFGEAGSVSCEERRR
jgi:hypothetical protein